MHPLETYLREMAEIRATGAGVPETSYYGTFERFVNEIGKTLKPKVRCILTLANRGAGNPDGGFFTASQFQRSTDKEPLAGQLPERGVIEIKPLSEDTWVTASGEQVSRYWGRYGLILVTNYRDFVLIGQDAAGQPVRLETFRFAKSESAFWALAEHPRKAVEAHGTLFTEYLMRAMLHAAPLSRPEDVAWFLASYARDAKARIEHAELPALSAVREALEEALGLRFEGKKGEHFFRSTLIQTLFYGVFSGWVLWSKQHSPGEKTARFDWRMAGWSLHVPMIKTLFHQLSDPGKLMPLGLVEPLDWTAAALNRVDRKAFFVRFDEGQAVQYFYEPFLQQFDPDLRKELGVWYTPPEIVKYMVARVDTVLRDELGIEDGLADPRVFVLDPCCGTGAYLVEVLHRIAATLRENRGDALIAQDLKKAAMKRLFGFEMLPAPFVVAHMQLGLLLQKLQAPLSGDSERVAVYLTNALTGWEPPKDPKHQLSFPEMEEERGAAEDIKREKPILVILGNPPYNAFAGVSPAEEQGLVEIYKEGLNRPLNEGGWGIRKFNLDDLYIRFFRLAERRIAELTGRGVVCFISNHSWISDASFVVLRKHLLDHFDRFWIENLHGNRKISEYAPDGRTSETVFAIAGFSTGIQQGVATSLWVKSGNRDSGPKVRFRDDINAAKADERRAQLLASLEETDFNAHYEYAFPSADNRYSLRPSTITGQYMAWPKLVDLCAEPPSNGLMEKRGGALIDINRDALEQRMRMYYDQAIDWEALKAECPNLTEDLARFDAKKARSKVLAAERFQPSRLLRYALRPYDHRWCYYSGIRPLWNEPRPSLWAQCWEGNSFLISRVYGAKCPEGPPFYFASIISDDHLLAPDASCFPLRLRASTAEMRSRTNAELFIARESVPTANLSVGARAYLLAFGVENPDADVQRASLLWMHSLAIGYSPAYLKENKDGIRQDWPRIPLPNSREVLEESAHLGCQVAALLDTESGVRGVTSASVRAELRPICVISKIGGGSIDPGAGGLDLTMGWGYFGKGNAVMPGKGKVVERDYTAEELRAIEEGADSIALATDQAREQLGESTCDVYLNSAVCWRNVPINVWGYTIGGYQVIKKWLSYRERDVLGRGLTIEEAREVTTMARRIAAVLLMQPALNRNYERVKRKMYRWDATANLPAGVP